MSICGRTEHSGSHASRQEGCAKQAALAAGSPPFPSLSMPSPGTSPALRHMLPAKSGCVYWIPVSTIPTYTCRHMRRRVRTCTALGIGVAASVLSQAAGQPASCLPVCGPSRNVASEPASQAKHTLPPPNAGRAHRGAVCGCVPGGSGLGAKDSRHAPHAIRHKLLVVGHYQLQGGPGAQGGRAESGHKQTG